MEILVNGDQQQLANGATVQQLLEELQLGGRIAVELNGEIIPKASFTETALQDGDRLEIVRAIGGG